MKLPEDPYVLELLPEFIDTWIVDIDEQYDKYLKEKNADELYRLAHTLKGSCFQFGLDEIAEMGIRLMGFCKEKNWEKAAALKDPIKSRFVKAKSEIETML
ncbi:MAG: Hpt domain-containing protein [Candidatus Kapaibacterium sp.]